MRAKLILALLAALTLSGCTAMGCGENSNNSQASGACGGHVTF